MTSESSSMQEAVNEWPVLSRLKVILREIEVPCRPASASSAKVTRLSKGGKAAAFTWSLPGL
jgi:hypothetical protein